MLRAAPDGRVHDSFKPIGVRTKAAALNVLQLHEKCELLAIEACLVIDIAVRVGRGDDARPEIEQFFDRELRDVAAA
jgi:hypothetical protein